MTSRHSRAEEVAELRRKARDLIRNLRAARARPVEALEQPVSAGRVEPSRDFRADPSILGLLRAGDPTEGDGVADDAAALAPEAQVDATPGEAAPPAIVTPPHSGEARPDPSPPVTTGARARAAPKTRSVKAVALGIVPLAPDGSGPAIILDPVTVQPQPSGPTLGERIGLEAILETRKPARRARKAPASVPDEKPLAPKLVAALPKPAAKKPAIRPLKASDIGLSPVVAGGESLLQLEPARPKGRSRDVDPGRLGLEPIVPPSRVTSRSAPAPVPAAREPGAEAGLEPVMRPVRLPRRVVERRHPSIRNGGAAEAIGLERISTAPPTEASGLATSGIEAIETLGPGLVWRLHGMGLRSLADLAAADPDVIRSGLGEVGRLVRPDDWVARARALLAHDQAAADTPDSDPSASAEPLMRAVLVAASVPAAALSPPSGVAGGMLVTGARAIAVIEGPPAAVLQATATVFAAGSAGMTLLDCRNVTDRLFPGSWFVAACEEDDDDLGVTTDIIRLTNAVAEACPDRTLPD